MRGQICEMGHRKPIESVWLWLQYAGEVKATPFMLTDDSEMSTILEHIFATLYREREREVWPVYALKKDFSAAIGN